MTLRLLKTHSAIDTCKVHLDSCGASGTEIESFLTQHVLVVLCADVQQEIYSILEARLNEVSDTELKNFSLTTGKKVFRSIGKKEISGFLGHFSPKAKAYLDKNISDQDVALYNSAVSRRHDVAHKTGTNITFRELSAILISAGNILTAIESAISPNRHLS
jgi:hypothetical protein